MIKYLKLHIPEKIIYIFNRIIHTVHVLYTLT